LGKHVDTQDLNQRISKLRADGSESALELATQLEQDAEGDAPEKLGVESDAQQPEGRTADGSRLVEGTPVDTPAAPPLPDEPEVAQAPPSAEERLADSRPFPEPGQPRPQPQPSSGPEPDPRPE